MVGASTWWWWWCATCATAWVFPAGSPLTTFGPVPLVSDAKDALFKKLMKIKKAKSLIKIRKQMNGESKSSATVYLMKWQIYPFQGPIHFSIVSSYPLIRSWKGITSIFISSDSRDQARGPENVSHSFLDQTITRVPHQIQLNKIQHPHHPSRWISFSLPPTLYTVSIPHRRGKGSTQGNLISNYSFK